MPLPDDCPIPDPLDLLAYLAATTERIVLATGVLVAPEHNPVQLAKRCATIDVLSGGRLRLGVGVGWMREELESVGVDFATRGARTDEVLAALHTLWRDEPASFSGRFFSFDGVISRPRPLRSGGVPIHVGGHSSAAARRAGRFGAGFQPLGLAGEALTARVDEARAAAVAAGRDPDAIELSLGGVLGAGDATDVAIEAAMAAGADRVLLSTRDGKLDLVCEQLSAFADRWM